MTVSLYNVKLSADLPVFHYWKTASARNSWLASKAGSDGTVTFQCNLLFPDDGGFIQIPTDTSISDSCTYAVFDNGTESRCYFVREVGHTARGAATLRLELDMWGTWYGVGHLEDIQDLHITAGHMLTGNIRPLTATIQAPEPFKPTDAADTTFDIFPSGKYAAVGIFAMPNYYRMVIATDSNDPANPPAESYANAAQHASDLARITKIKESSETVEKPVEYDNVSAVGVWIVPAELIATIWGDYLLLSNKTTYFGYWMPTVPIVSLKFSNFTETSISKTFIGRYIRKCEKKALGVTRVIKIGSTFHEYTDVLADLSVQVTITANDNSLAIWLSTDGDNVDITDEYSVPVYSDQAQSYYSQHKTSIGVGMISSGVSLVGSLAAKNVVGAVGAGLSLANQMGQLSERLKQPCRVNGTPSGFVACDPNGDKGGRWYYLPGYNIESVINNYYKYGNAIDKYLLELSELYFFPVNVPYYDTTTGLSRTDRTVTIPDRFFQVDRCTCYSPGYGINAAERVKRALLTGVRLIHE